MCVCVCVCTCYTVSVFYQFPSLLFPLCFLSPFRSVHSPSLLSLQRSALGFAVGGACRGRPQPPWRNELQGLQRPPQHHALNAYPGIPGWFPGDGPTLVFVNHPTVQLTSHDMQRLERMCAAYRHACRGLREQRRGRQSC